jgi:hypothetical protein
VCGTCRHAVEITERAKGTTYVRQGREGTCMYLQAVKIRDVDVPEAAFDGVSQGVLRRAREAASSPLDPGAEGGTWPIEHAWRSSCVSWSFIGAADACTFGCMVCHGVWVKARQHVCGLCKRRERERAAHVDGDTRSRRHVQPHRHDLQHTQCTNASEKSARVQWRVRARTV